MPDIKTRQVIKGTIKTLDKAAIASQRMKSSYVRAKSASEPASQSSAQQYASEKLEGRAEYAARSVVYRINQQGCRAVKQLPQNVDNAKAQIEALRAELPRKEARRRVEKQAELRTRQTLLENNKSPHEVSPGKSVRVNSRTVISTVTSSKHTTARTAAESSVRAVQISKYAVSKAGASIKKAGKAAVAAAKAVFYSTKALVTALLAGGWLAFISILVVVVFGCAISMLGTNSTASSVSEEVNAYTPIIQLYANEHGIPAYVELIKAVMMQESAGRGSDPMQASESAYNTRYPNAPNGITDPEYSIDVGVQALASVLSLAGVESPIDMEGISLSLQGYNYGPGYISWALSNYGGYSIENACEFSDMMAGRMGWSNYGDTQYVSHVLQYYSLKYAINGGSQAIAQVALSQLGDVGGHTYWSWYGYNNRVEWCGCFASWCAAQCGYIDAGTMPKFAWCNSGISWFQQNGQWLDASSIPEPGMLIFFDWASTVGQDGVSDHVGIVTSVQNGVIYTIEGNVNDSCVQSQYPVGYYAIMGYGFADN